MKKLLIAVVCSLAFLSASFSQNKPTEVFLAPDAPQWVRLLEAPNPNVWEIQAAYKAYYREHPFEKTTFTQYYKRWMHWARQYVQADGSLYFPTSAEQEQAEAQRKALRHKATPGTENLTTWNFVGPKSTWDTDGNPKVTWQTNIYSFDVSLSNTSVLYAGGETGGLWKTTDKGMNWTLLTAGITHGAFGAVKIHPTDPNTVYACTGGKIIKSTNGGTSWSSVYTESNLWVNEMAISTADPNIVLAAADQGLLRSTNGGTTWTKLFVNTTWTVKFKPDDPTVVFAIRDNGTSCDFLKSTNSGSSYTAYNTGLYVPPSGESVTGAIVAVCPSSPNQLYTYFCGSGTNLYGYIGVYKSTDGGQTWTNTNPANSIGNSPTAYTIPSHTNLMAHNGTTGFDQGFYDMAIVVNPSNANQLIAGGTSWFKSDDGGATWAALGSYVGGLSWSHPDIQATVAVGSDLWISSDGGLNYSNDWAATIEARMTGISGADLWGFDSGWNEDILVGGRYHNGNMAYHESFPAGQFYRMGGGEAATGYVSPGPERKVYHSDIGGHILKPGFGNGATGFSVGLWPNESYAYYANSEMVWHPQCWGIVYTGFENKIWKSTDGGASYSALYTFPGTATNEVYDIEIARSNPLVMYCSQWDGTDDKIWRTDDGGQNWSACTALPLPNNNDRVKLAVSDASANILWAAVTYGSNGKKIYKSTDGGVSWTNLTTNTLNGIRIANIMAQYGTNDGIYLGTDAGVFYRNNTHTDWQAYSDGLPLSAETNRLKPFYRDGKIRNGTWGFGVWEAPLFEPSSTTIRAQAMTDKLSASCARDTFYFDDYSPVLHAGASWSWTFTGAQTVIGANTRTPKVVFGTPGNKQAVMTLTTPNGSFLDTLYLSVSNACEMDSLPGNALLLDGSGDYAVANQALNLNSDTVSITAWVKPVGAQNDWAGIVFCRGGTTTAGISLRSSNNELRYHWNDNGWSWGSGLLLPDNQWSHVAIVVTANNVTLYLNGVAAVHNVAQGAEAFDAPIKIGHDNGSRYLKGYVEEVCVYNNKALTQNEIREIMHLARTHTPTTGLVSYYQFNEISGIALDRSGIRHLSFVGDAARATSTCPVGPGFSIRQTITGAGTYNLPTTGLTLQFPATGPYPNGELAMTRINWSPDFIPGSDPVSPAYWVIRNYGSNSTFNQLTSIQFDQIGPVSTGTSPNEYRLYKRGSNADGDTWTTQDQADQLVYGINGSATYSTANNITSFSQFLIGKPVGALPAELLDFQATVTGKTTVGVAWTTGAEAGIGNFIVEHSADGIHFSPIGTVAPKGSGSTYRFDDLNALSGISYYRLRIQNLNTSEQFSIIRQVMLPGEDSFATVYPNPAARNEQITITTNLEGAVHFRLFDAKGRAIVVKEFETELTLDLKNLDAGTYIYRVDNFAKMYFGKISIY